MDDLQHISSLGFYSDCNEAVDVWLIYSSSYFRLCVLLYILPVSPITRIKVGRVRFCNPQICCNFRLYVQFYVVTIPCFKSRYV